MVVPRKTKEAEITEQDSLVLGAGNKMHPVHPADKCKGPIQPVDKGASDEKHPVRTIDKGKGPAWPVNIGANGNQAEHVLPDLQMHPFGGNMDKVCIVPGRLYQKLQPHQQEGLHWLWRIYCQHSGGIVADDMGMGKTLQTVAFLSGLLHSDIIRRAMIIVPVSVLASWSEELTNAGLAKHFHIYHGSGERGLQIVNGRGGILVTTYETYGSKFKELTAVDWDYTILDEAHRIKNLMSNVRKQVDNIECRKKLLLTGTPLPRNLLDIFSLMKFIKPDVLGDQHTFHKKYMRPVELGQYLNSTERNKKRFIKALASCRKEISPYILRRTKSVLIESGELPCKKTELIVWLRLTELQAEIYSRFCKIIDQESHAWYDEDKSTITQGVICRHICNGPELLLEAIDRGQGNSVRRLAKRLLESFDHEVWKKYKNSCKISFILDLVNELFEEEKAEKKKGMRKNKNLKILIVSQFISMLDRIEIALKAIGKEGDTIRIDGSMERTERDQKNKKFSSQVEDAPKIFLLSARVGGEGLNLTAATRVIIVDPSWNISDDNQIADRVFRIGQKEDVTVNRLVTCMTIEEDIYKTQILKGNLARAILEGKVCSPLVELEDRKFIRLPECGFNSSKTQQLLETLMGDILEMRSRHQRFLQKHHLVAGLTNQEMHDLLCDEEASSSEERHATKASKGAKSYKQERQNVRSLNEKPKSCHHSKKRDDASLEHEEDSLTTTSRRIYIPANKVGALIGTGGNTIERIKIRSSAIIRINPDGHWRGKFPDPCPVEIRGALGEITTAVQLITEAVSKENETYIEGATDGGVEIHFSVPQHMIGLIIGSGGRRVQSIEHESGARISHIKHESKFRIRGTLEEVNNAKGIMSDIINKHAGSSSYGGEGKRILKQDHKAQVSGESTHDRPPGSFYTTRATGLSSGRGSGHMYRSAMDHTLRPPQGMPSPRARSEYYGERGTGIAFSPPGNFEHQLEGQNYHPRIGPEDCRDQIQDTVLWPGEEPPTKG